MRSKKTKKNKFPIVMVLLLVAILPIGLALKLYLESLFRVEVEFVSILVVMICLYLLILINVLPKIHTKKPKETEDLASSRWATDAEMKEFFGIAKIDMKESLDVGGSPITKLDDEHVLYEKENIHTLTIATTMAGKSRKIARGQMQLLIKAKESMIVNDPKREFYFDYKHLLKKQGYSVYIFDLRNLESSDCWNPLEKIIDAFADGDRDEADQYAQDMVTAIVEDNGQGERIWIEGQKALLKAAILAVCKAPIQKSEKNMFSVYQLIALLGKPESTGGKVKSKLILSSFMEHLKEDDVARTAFTTVSNSPEKTAGSFMAVAMSTLQIFTSQKLAKTLSKSDFKFEETEDRPIAVFVVNPHEKKTYSVVAKLFWDQAYMALVTLASRQTGNKLRRRINFILDEFGNMPRLTDFDTKITIARSANILYHLFVQDFAMMDSVYGDKIAKTIRGNCNLWYFIASADYDTCKEVEQKLGYSTKWIGSIGTSYDQRANVGGANLNFNQQTRALLDANELMQYDSRDGNRIILCRTYMKPIKAYLPDISKYAWYKDLKHDEQLEKKQDRTLNWAVPRRFQPSAGSEPVWYWSHEKLDRDVLLLLQRNQVRLDCVQRFFDSREFLSWRIEKEERMLHGQDLTVTPEDDTAKKKLLKDKQQFFQDMPEDSASAYAEFMQESFRKFKQRMKALMEDE